MQTQDHRKINSPGQGHGVHVCNKCGWSFPNPHPSAKHRRAHKKICGTVEGRKLATTSDENKPNLDEHLSEDDSKNPSLEVMKKVEEEAITRRSRSGVGSRSDEDVFSDAVNEFADVPAVTGSDVVGETAAVVMQGSSSEDVEVTQQVVGKAVEDAGDLYPPNSDDGTQLQNVECSRPENERLEIDMPSQHHLSSSTIDSISNSDSSVKEASVSESTLQCSKIDNVLDSEEKGDLEAALDKKSEDAANVSSENAGKASEAILLHQKVNGDDNNDCSYEVNFAGETTSSEKGKVKTDKSEDFTNIPIDFVRKTSEAVSVPQMVNTDDLNILPVNAAMDVNERQVEGFFDARNISFSKDDFVGQINSIEEVSNVEADSSLEMLEGHGSINVPDDLPLKEHSEDVLEDYEDHETEKLPDVVSIDLAQEVECVELGKDDVNKDVFFNTSLDEPSKSLNKNSEDIVAEALYQEDCSAEEVSVEKKVETHATDADICGPISVAVHPVKDDNEIVQGVIVTSPEEETSVAFVDTNLKSVLDESGNLTHSINGVQPVLNDLEHDKKDTQIFDALEADSAKAEEEKLPTTTDSAVEYDVRIREVEENLSGSTPIVAQSDDGRDDEVEVQRDDEHVSKTALSETSKASLEKFEDSETEVKDLGSSSKHMVGGECVNLLGTNVISGIDNNANMTEDTHFEENCVASDSVDAILFNNEMNNETQQDENEVFEDAKERENFDEKVSGEVCPGKVDLGLISDNDDSIDLTQNTSNKIEAGVQVEAVSAVDDGVTKNKEGSGSNLGNDNGNLVKQEEPVPDLDVQVDSISQTDSLEGNWGSASVLSAISDATAGTEFGSQPSQSSVIVEKAGLQPNSNVEKSHIFKLPADIQLPEQKVDESGQNEGVPEAQTSEKANESSGSKKTEEIIAKVANWSTASGKEQHMSLKSFLGDSSSPNAIAKDNPPLKTQETEKAVTGNNAKEPADETVPGEMQKEWNSPARYPTNIKREKGKVRSKPYWAPFICCSSVQTS